MCAGIAADWTDISGKEGVRIPDKSIFMLTRHDCDVFQFGAAFQGISLHAAAIGINEVTSFPDGGVDQVITDVEDLISSEIILKDELTTIILPAIFVMSFFIYIIKMHSSHYFRCLNF